jgi:hypothetical protein
MLEEAPGIFGTDRTERRRYRIQQSLLAPGRGLAKQLLDLGKRLFDEPTTVRLYTRASSSGYTIILSSQLDPLPVSCEYGIHEAVDATGEAVRAPLRRPALPSVERDRSTAGC